VADWRNEHPVSYNHREDTWDCRDSPCEFRLTHEELEANLKRVVSKESGHTLWIKEHELRQVDVES
jgi:hypothetical protein